MDETIMDSSGRVTLGRKTAAKYGNEFFMVRMPNEIVLIPKSKCRSR